MQLRTIAIEEHLTTAAIDRALREEGRDPSVALNDRGDIPAQLLDLGELRLAAMDAAGVDVQVLSLTPPGTGELRDAVALSREANDLTADAVRRHPDRFRAMTAVATSDPDAAVAELERSAGLDGHVGLMLYGRTGERPLDDPAHDELLAAAARLGRPVFVHPQIPSTTVRQASYSGLGELTDLGLATFGWGWHLEAGLSALRLILRGTFDRLPELQLVLGHWGELLLFNLERADGLSNVAPHLERRVREYVQSNVHVATSGMLEPHLLHHALAHLGPERILLSGDHPFHRMTPAGVAGLLDALPDPADRARVAGGNAERLYGI